MTEPDTDTEIDIEIDGDELELEKSHLSPQAVQITASPAIPQSAMGYTTTHNQANRHSDHTKKQLIQTGIGTTYKDQPGSPEAEVALMEEFQIPEWVTQEYRAQAGFDTAGVMDEKSRAMIQSMLAEEEFYSGRPSKIGKEYSFQYSGPRLSTSKGKHQESKKRKSSDDWSGKTKRTASEDARWNTKLSSADLPSHNTRWTVEEDERLREGLRIHGHGNWKAIASVVGTRNALQVKNHARHLVVTDKIPHDASTNTSDAEGLDKNRSSAANSEDDGDMQLGGRKRRPRSKKVKRIGSSSVVGNESGYESFGRQGRRARSITSESGLDDFTGSEFGATSGYDTDNDEDLSTSKSPSLSRKTSSAGLTTPSPGLRPLFASLPAYPMTTQRTRISSMDEDEDIDVDIESSDEGAAGRLNLSRSLPQFAQKSKSRSISPFSNASSRSRQSSEFDSDSEQDLVDMEDDDDDETLESGSIRKLSTTSSPALSDHHGTTTGDPYTNNNFNTSSSSVNSTGTSSSAFKPSLKDVQYSQISYPQQKPHQMGPIFDKNSHLPKERRTVSFGAVHVAELQPDINSYDEEGGSSEDGGADWARPLSFDASSIPSPLSDAPFLSNPIGISQSSVRLDEITETPASILPAHVTTTTTRHVSGVNTSVSPVFMRPETELNGEEEEEDGSLGTGHRRPTLGGAALKCLQLPSTSTHRPISTSTSLSPSKEFVTSAVTTRSYSPGSASIAPSLTMNNSTGARAVPRILNKDVITDEEKQVHAEFFSNKASKTPERYQRIRNTILQAWEKSPSTYLTKTSVRSGLKDCGDVNAIGRVHSWLETIGAINVGMTASSPGASLARPRNGGNNSSKRRVHSEERGWSSSSSSSAPAISRRSRTIHVEENDTDSTSVNLPNRRRRVRNEKGEWVDEGDAEGHAIDHSKRDMGGRRMSADEDDSQLTESEYFERHGMTREDMEEEYEQERLAAQNAKYFAASEVVPVNTRVPKNKRAQHYLRQTRGHHHNTFTDQGDMEGVSEGYDPFRLIPLRKYNQQHPAPFRVKVSSDAMLIMDFHSHLAETEIIGLLGGLYDEDERILFILSVFPCRSLSTSLQCEIDPVSDIEARSFFSSKGFVVVGWYHSHPTFEPTPSIRDIENQTDYQTMFRRHELGVEPFVGVIVSPFDPRNLSYISEFQFLSVSDQFDENLNCRLPFCYVQETTRTNELSVSVFKQISDLVRYYRSYEHLVDLSQPLRKGETMTKLDKMLRSLNKYIFVDEVIGRAFLSKVQELVVKGFKLSLNGLDRISPHSTLFSASSRSSVVPSLAPTTSSTTPSRHHSPGASLSPQAPISSKEPVSTMEIAPPDITHEPHASISADSDVLMAAQLRD
ncbi:hypothetical protein BG004_000471 [Podila humilis]|nr:hypothetical protein BG004_000471 [Podila humilis]